MVLKLYGFLSSTMTRNASRKRERGGQHLRHHRVDVGEVPFCSDRLAVLNWICGFHYHQQMREAEKNLRRWQGNCMHLYNQARISPACLPSLAVNAVWPTGSELWFGGTVQAYLCIQCVQVVGTRWRNSHSLQTSVELVVHFVWSYTQVDCTLWVCHRLCCLLTLLIAEEVFLPCVNVMNLESCQISCLIAPLFLVKCLLQVGGDVMYWW